MQRTRESYQEAGRIGAKRRWETPTLPTIEERFWSKVNVGKPDECWTWKHLPTGCHPHTRGMFRMKGRRLSSSNRAAFEIANGPIPKGMCVCHKCDNPPCCNPAHLFLGTQKDNNLDAKRKGRSAIGEKHGNSKFKNHEVEFICKLLDEGVGVCAIARMFKTSHSIVSDINRGVSYTHITHR